ncbi:MAG: hypothetical protein RL208_91 [Pseudomonadota bacterium]|jgi:hypothetical protein
MSELNNSSSSSSVAIAEDSDRTSVSGSVQESSLNDETSEDSDAFDTWVENNNTIPLDFQQSRDQHRHCYNLFRDLYMMQIVDDLTMSWLIDEYTERDINFKNNLNFVAYVNDGVVNISGSLNEAPDDFTSSLLRDAIFDLNDGSVPRDVESIKARFAEVAGHIRNINNTLSSVIKESATELGNMSDSHDELIEYTVQEDNKVTLRTIVGSVIRNYNRNNSNNNQRIYNFEEEFLNPLRGVSDYIRGLGNDVKQRFNFNEFKRKCITDISSVDDFRKKLEKFIISKTQIKTTCRDNQFLGNKRKRDDKDPEGGVGGGKPNFALNNINTSKTKDDGLFGFWND